MRVPRWSGREARWIRTTGLALLLISLTGSVCNGAEPMASADSPLVQRLDVVDANGRPILAVSGAASCRMLLRVRNTSDAPITLPFSSAQLYEFSVVDASGREVWRFSQGMRFAQMLTELRLEAGEERVFEESWNLTLASGDRLPTGHYRATASLTSGRPTPAEAEFELR